jgi:hypothetical protein
MDAIPERSLDFRGCLERSADCERFDDGAGKLGSHVTGKPEDAGYVEFHLPPGGQKPFQTLAVVHYDTCHHQPACGRLREIHAVLMQQIARCGLQEGVAARVKSLLHQKIYLLKFIRIHGQLKFFTLCARESPGTRRAYQARHCQEALLPVFPFALLFMVCHFDITPMVCKCKFTFT